MNDYAKRGYHVLKSIASTILISIPFFLFEKTRFYVLLTLLLMIFRDVSSYIAYRKMTPEKFAQHQKKMRMVNDERNELLMYKSSRIAFISMFLVSLVGLSLFAVYENEMGAWITGTLVIIGVVSFLIAKLVYSKRL